MPAAPSALASSLPGLVLTGGGARGAYQAGALAAIAEITRAARLPFRVLSGSSAGSLNAAFLGARPADFAGAAQQLSDLWCDLEPHRVFRTDTPTLMKTAGEWMADLGLGGWIGTGRGHALLDTAPLRDLVESVVDMGGLQRSVREGEIAGIAVTATNYQSGQSVTFFDGAPSIEPWSRVTRVGVRTTLTIDHLLASAAIPVFFPAVRIDGDWYADGCIRLSTPLSPAIRMGARRIVAIGMRHQAAGQHAASAEPHAYPSTAEVAGVLLNALFLDALEADVERASRINQTVRLLSAAAVKRHAVPLVPVSLLVLRPSVDPASLVLETLEHFPATVRHLFRGIGASRESGADLLSYLAFDGAYTSRLAKLGRDDTMARADEVKAFLVDT